MEELVGVPEIAELFGITRQGVYRLLQRETTFPPPAAELAAGRVWRREAVEGWAMSRGPEARRDYLAAMQERAPQGPKGSAASHYRMALQLGLSSAVAPEGDDPADEAEAHRLALEAAREVEPAFKAQPPPSFEEWAVLDGRLCEMHKRPAKYRQEAHGRTIGYCDDCVPYNPPPQFFPAEGRATSAPNIPEDL